MVITDKRMGDYMQKIHATQRSGEVLREKAIVQHLHNKEKADWVLEIKALWGFN